MKKIYISFFTLLALFTQAQTLTQSFNEPVVGDVDKNYRLDTSAYTSGLPISITGTNCVWNFSNLTGTFPMIVDSFMLPAAAVGATAYPGASFVQHRDQLYTYFKSNTTSTQTELLGAYSPSMSLTFTNSAIIAGYPVNFGYNLTDPVSGTFRYNTTNGACNGNITISAPATGTVNFPNNVSIPNVICLKSVEILTLSVNLFPFGTFNQTIYNFYMPGKKFPILNINYTTYQFIAGTPTITAYVYGSNNYYTVAGIPSAQLDASSIQVYPNPFHDQLNIQTNAMPYENTYSVFDLSGQLMFSSIGVGSFETAELAPGIYLLEIKNKTGSYHKKIIKD